MRVGEGVEGLRETEYLGNPSSSRMCDPVLNARQVHSHGTFASNQCFPCSHRLIYCFLARSSS